MIRRHAHLERHRSGRVGWLRAGVLGANDGIVSTASLILGVAAAGAAYTTVLLTAIAGLVAGAMSMAAGEFISVHSQQDTEKADLAREKHEIEQDPQGEQRELKAIYVARGLSPELASEVAEQLMAHDALEAHARDELGLTSAMAARPVQAALASSASFAFGAGLPLAVAAIAGITVPGQLVVLVWVFSILSLAALGALSAQLGGAPRGKGIWRVTFWGALAMLVTSGAGALFDVVT